MVRPQNLRPAVEIDLLEGLLARMGARKGDVAGRVPVLRHDPKCEFALFDQPRDRIDDLVPFGDRKIAGGHEIGLKVDDEEDGSRLRHGQAPGEALEDNLRPARRSSNVCEETARADGAHAEDLLSPARHRQAASTAG
jgi:hypothetical protein